MTVKKQGPEESLGLDKFAVDEEEAHIVLDKTICEKCKDKPCLVVCPAVLYTLKDGTINFDYAGCLECGTCRVMCAQKGVAKWTYPRGGFGIAFRYG
jgi:ferredoxin like protein